MKKFYFFILFSAVIVPAISQQQQIADKVTIPLYTQNREGIAESPIIMVHKGEVFNIEADFIAPKKKTLFGKIIKGAGVAAVAYQSEQLVQQYVNENKKGVTQTTSKKNWLLPVGAGVAISADKLLPKVTAQTTICYQLYNNKNELVSTINIPVTNTKKPFVISDRVTESGYLRVQFVSDAKRTIRNGNINITLREPTVEEEDESVTEVKDITAIVPPHINLKQEVEVTPTVLPAPVVANTIFNEVESQLNGTKPVVATKQIIKTIAKPISNKPVIKNNQPGENDGDVVHLKAVPSKKTIQSVKQPTQPVNLPEPVEAVLPEEIKIKEELGEGGINGGGIGIQPDMAVAPEDDDDDDGLGNGGEDDDDDGGGIGYIGGGDGGGGSGGGDGTGGSGGTGGGDPTDPTGPTDPTDPEDDDDDPGYGEWFYYTDPNTGITYAIQLDPGETGYIDGMEIIRNEDGSYTYYENDGDVAVTSYTKTNTVDVVLESIGLGADVNSGTFESISVLTESVNSLKPILGPFTWAGIFAGGLESAIDIISRLLKGQSLSDIPSSTWITLGIAFITAALMFLGPGILGAAITEIVSLLLSLGASIWDIWGIINNNG